MKNFIIEEENIKILIQIFEELGNVEVKGDSVIHLYNSRMSIKKVVESIKELTVTEEKIKENKED